MVRTEAVGTLGVLHGRDEVAVGAGSWLNEGDAERIGKWKIRVEIIWTKMKKLYGVKGRKCVGIEDDKR
jgi:hypothetical protein